MIFQQVVGAFSQLPDRLRHSFWSPVTRPKRGDANRVWEVSVGGNSFQRGDEPGQQARVR